MAIIYGIADSERSLLDKLPNEVKNVDDVDRVKKEIVKKWGKERSWFKKKSLGGMVFSGIKRVHYKRQLDKFQYKKIGKIKRGTHGENDVIDELSKLDDNYHILCGMEIDLGRWTTYDGEKNLKSAQMDVVVVCPTGVFMIEVKNWTDEFVKKQHWKFSPYEQTDRAGRVLWIAMQDILDDCKITNVLLSIKGNLPYNNEFKFVNISSLGQISNFITKRQPSLDEDEVKLVVKKLSDFIMD